MVERALLTTWDASGLSGTVDSNVLHKSHEVPGNPRGFIRPRRMAELVRYGGAAARRSAPSDKAYMQAAGCSQSTANRRRNGDPHSPEAFTLSVFEFLAAGEKTSAVPLFIQSWTVVMEREIGRMSSAACEAERVQLALERCDVEREIRAAELRGDDSALADAHSRAAEIHVKQTAIARRLIVLRRS
jgi:hypothetical protein